MDIQPILIDGHWRAASAPAGQFRAENPATGSNLAAVAT